VKSFSLSESLSRLKNSIFPIAQIVLAAMTSYFIARFGLGHPVPLLAVTVSVSSLGFTRDTRPQRVASIATAMVLGIAISEALLLSFGSGVLQLGFALALALVAARFVSKNPSFALVVATQTVLVQLLDAPTGGVFARSIDGLLGGLVALSFTALAPRNPVKLARKDAAKLFEVFRLTLEDLRSVFQSPDIAKADRALERIRQTQPLIDTWKEALDSAFAISRISPFYRWAEKELEEQKRVLRGMDLATRNLRVVARRADYLVRDQKPRAELAQLFTKLIASVDLVEQSTSDFSVAQRARKYLKKNAASLTPIAFKSKLSVSDTALLMQVRPMWVDLCVAAGMDAEEARELLPEVD